MVQYKCNVHTHNGGRRMMKEINMDEMEYGTPEYAAAELITLCGNEIAKASEWWFGTWFRSMEKMDREYIQWVDTKITLPSISEKKAALYFIAFWYYRNKEQ